MITTPTSMWDPEHALWRGYLLVDKYDFAQWQRHVHADAHSMFEHPKLTDVQRLMIGLPKLYNYRNATTPKAALAKRLVRANRQSHKFSTHEGKARGGSEHWRL